MGGGDRSGKMIDSKGEKYFEQWKRCQKTDFELFGIGQAVFLGTNEVKENLGEFV